MHTTTARTAPRSDPRIRRLLAATFPAYTGRTIRVMPWTRPVHPTWNWDAGHRDYVAIIDPGRGIAHPVPPAPWAHDHPGLAPEAFGPGAILVLHQFAGTRQHITIYAAPADPLLASGARELTP